MRASLYPETATANEKSSARERQSEERRNVRTNSVIELPISEGILTRDPSAIEATCSVVWTEDIVQRKLTTFNSWAFLRRRQQHNREHNETKDGDDDEQRDQYASPVALVRRRSNQFLQNEKKMQVYHFPDESL